MGNRCDLNQMSDSIFQDSQTERHQHCTINQPKFTILVGEFCEFWKYHVLTSVLSIAKFIPTAAERSLPPISQSICKPCSRMQS